ncbi:hypothetical protein [Streptomyces sp. NPDC005017]|uniref:hypothetical protein n=1 Tax=Streptomyces sp. NPDC005017 TaxID=3364706 RepID=UPI0036B0B194
MTGWRVDRTAFRAERPWIPGTAADWLTRLRDALNDTLTRGDRPDGPGRRTRRRTDRLRPPG